MFQVIDADILQFIVSAKVPLMKFIRHELACRGIDEKFNYLGFDKAKAIWLKNN